VCCSVLHCVALCCSVAFLITRVCIHSLLSYYEYIYILTHTSSIVNKTCQKTPANQRHGIRACMSHVTHAHASCHTKKIECTWLSYALMCVAGRCSMCCRVLQCVLRGVTVCAAGCCSVCCMVLHCKSVRPCNTH